MKEIWSNDPASKTFEFCFEDMKEANPDADVYTIYDFTAETLDDLLNDERANLHIHVGGPIVCFGDLDLWFGRRKGYKIIESGMISDCLRCDQDYNTWYIDDKGDLCCTAVHHDGTNQYRYRALKPGVSLDTVCGMKLTPQNIGRFTRSVGKYVCDVYGW